MDFAIIFLFLLRITGPGEGNGITLVVRSILLSKEAPRTSLSTAWVYIIFGLCLVVARTTLLIFEETASFAVGASFLAYLTLLLICDAVICSEQPTLGGKATSRLIIPAK